MVNYVFQGQYCFNVYNQDKSNWDHKYSRTFNTANGDVTVSGMSFSGSCENNSFDKEIKNTYSNPSFGNGNGYGGTNLWKF